MLLCEHREIFGNTNIGAKYAFQFVIVELLSNRKDNWPPCPLDVVTDGDFVFHPIPTCGQRMMQTCSDTHAHREKSSPCYWETEERHWYFLTVILATVYSWRMLQYHWGFKFLWRFKQHSKYDSNALAQPGCLSQRSKPWLLTLGFGASFPLRFHTQQRFLLCLY